MTRWKISRPRILALLVSITLANAAYSAEAELKANPFWESIQPDVNVSGFVVVGLTTGSLLSGSDILGIQLRPPGSMNSKEVCLTVQSRDGVYISRNTYILPPSIDNEPVNLPYSESTALDLLEEYKKEHLAISVLSGNCQDPGDVYLPPYGPGNDTSTGINLMINGFGATDVFYSAPTIDKTGTCQALHDGRTTIFDFWCHIDLPAPLDNDLQIRIDRERYGRPLPPATLSVATSSSNLRAESDE